MHSITGIGVAKGIAIGETFLLQRGRIDVSISHIPQDQVFQEIERYRLAVESARAQLKTIKSKIPSDTRSDILAFIDTHLLMLDDAAFVAAPIELIAQNSYTAESALQVQRNALVKVFDEMEDPYLRTRKDDVDHVVNQIHKGLLNQAEDTQSNALEGKVILAQDLSPADTILMKHQGIAAFITEYGGPMSHTAILARSLGIPAIVGLHSATQLLGHGRQVIVDGGAGLVISDVDEQTLILYRQRIVDNLEQAKQLSKLIGKPAITRDGMQLSLMANIELPEDIATTRALQADGVGLYRTEFLYMNRDTPPDEDEHYEAYRSVVEGLNGIPVTIRTLDLGADKQVDGCLGNTPVCNPALGLRAIRLCIKEPRLFLPQLRAILRASAHGPVRIMVPMLSTLSEVAALKQHLEAAKLSLSQDGTPFDPNIQVGGMIEVPAAALSADRFANALDFLSIGTNDLIQYTLAIDRVDDEVNYLFDPLHPAILRLIKMVIDAGRHYNKPVSMCGEMAGDPSYIPLLLGMGLQEYSMQPGALLDAKRLLCELDAGKLSERTDRLFQHLHEADISERIAQICQEY